MYLLSVWTFGGRTSWERSTVSNGLGLLRNMNDVSNSATCRFSSAYKAGAKYFIFKGLGSSSLPGSPKCDAFDGTYKGLTYFIFC